MDVCCHCWYDYLQTCPPNTRWQTRAALTGTPYYTKTPAPLMECTVIPCCIWTVVPVQVLDGIPVPLLWAAGPSGGVFHRVSAEWHQSAGGAWGLVQYVVTLSYKSICLFFQSSTNQGLTSAFLLFSCRCWTSNLGWVEASHQFVSTVWLRGGLGAGPRPRWNKFVQWFWGL